MMFLWIILPLIFLLLAGIYLLRKAYAAVCFFGRDLPKGKRMVTAGGICILLALPFVIVGSVWLVVLLHLTAFLLLADAVALVVRKTGRDKAVARFWKGLYRSGAVAALLTALVIGYGYYNIYHVVRTEYSVSAEKPIREEGYTIVFLSDLHYGLTLDSGQLREVVESVGQEKPDIVILGGDIVDETTTLAQMREAFSILGEIPSRHGIYYVYGNHDKSRYSAEPNYDEAQLAVAIGTAGIHILEDAVCEVNEELVLVGRADRSDRMNRKSLAQLAEGLDDGAEWILIDHQPSDYVEAQENGYGLVLSGHTHSGQIWPGGFFSELFRFNEWNYGYKEQGNLKAIVSSGIAGWGYPLRTERHSEYVVVRLLPGD